MNIHPIFVHFPIAFLVLYSCLEVAMLFPFIKDKEKWRSFLFFILGVGVLSAMVTLQTGEIAEHLLQVERGSSLHSLIEAHSLFADLSVYIYLVLLFGYCVKWLERKNIVFKNSFFVKVFAVLRKIADIIFSKVVLVSLALLGFVFLGITGALGGAITYGVDTDPVVNFVYNILLK